MSTKPTCLIHKSRRKGTRIKGRRVLNIKTGKKFKLNDHRDDKVGPDKHDPHNLALPADRFRWRCREQQLATSLKGLKTIEAVVETYLAATESTAPSECGEIASLYWALVRDSGGHPLIRDEVDLRFARRAISVAKKPDEPIESTTLRILTGELLHDVLWFIVQEDADVRSVNNPNLVLHILTLARCLKASSMEDNSHFADMLLDAQGSHWTAIKYGGENTLSYRERVALAAAESGGNRTEVRLWAAVIRSALNCFSTWRGAVDAFEATCEQRGLKIDLWAQTEVDVVAGHPTLAGRIDAFLLARDSKGAPKRALVVDWTSSECKDSSAKMADTILYAALLAERDNPCCLVSRCPRSPVRCLT